MNKDRINMTKKAVIIARTDAYANGVKPRELKRHLESKGFNVELLPSAQELKLGTGWITSRIPLIKPLPVFIGVVGLYVMAKLTPFKRLSVFFRSSARLPLNKSYAQLTHERLVKIAPDLVICENNCDIGFMTLPRVAKLQVLDLPAPWAEEIYYGGQLTTRIFKKMKSYEVEAYKSADALSFHWHTYSDFVKKTKYNGTNIIDISYGTNRKDKVAQYNKQPKVIFLGLLKGYWINIPLLERLTEIYPNIDVYGGPKPPKGTKINYKGYAPSLDVMAEYQFGLTTITDDELRKHSFSSKHLEYISYGLPVFTPSWRKDGVLDDSSIYFNDPEDFLAQLKKHSNLDDWEARRDAALSSAHKLTWDKAFVPLDKILKDKKMID